MKGGVWSAIDYEIQSSVTFDNLKKRGATAEQRARFRKLCADAPLIGGRFNPYSGD